jgi:hypothetical protein
MWDDMSSGHLQSHKVANLRIQRDIAASQVK